tara:strand:- start:302 stop:775 length:474 start_codon:yes stop_codon:yes gene_type:complete
MDPATAIATATAAFSMIKKGISFGKDIESMSKDVGRWMGALSDLDQAEKECKNPPLLKKLIASKSIEEEAMQVFMAKKKATEQREELRTWMMFTLGPDSWNQLLKVEGQIRKQRQEEIYRQRELRRKVVEIITVVLICASGIGLLVWFAIWLKQSSP